MRRQIMMQEEDSDVNLTPMLDMVFIMLIFFIVTASFVKEAGIDVTRPGAVNATAKPQATIFIAITKEGQVWIDKRQVDVRAVSANIERLLAENPKASVVVQADVDSKNGILVQVLDQAKMAEVENISISAEPIEM